jgi:type II secretory pathway pseudopilin PulG
MKARLGKSGFTLAELLVVVAGIAVLVTLGLPAIRAFLHSFESSGNARAMISAALASARAVAAKERRYAGIRFQKAYNPDDPDPLNAPQYMIFIVYNADMLPSVQGNLGCHAVPGVKPVKLPESVGVMDLILGSMGDEPVDTDADISEDNELRDVTTFSVLFDPAGRLVLHTHKAQQRQASDSVFNTQLNIESGVGMFIEDVDGASIQPFDELSRTGFIIYDRQTFKQAYENRPATHPDGTAYSGYLARLVSEAAYVNRYTGTIIKR